MRGVIAAGFFIFLALVITAVSSTSSPAAATSPGAPSATYFAAPLAQAPAPPSTMTVVHEEDSMGVGDLVKHLLAAAVFAVMGIAVLAISVWLIEWVTEFSVKKEILEDQNTALAIIVGALLIGISIIIAAAIAS